MTAAESLKTAKIIKLPTSISDADKKAPLSVKNEILPLQVDCSDIARELQNAFEQAEAEKAAKALLEKSWDHKPSVNQILTGTRCKNALVNAHEEQGGAKEHYVIGMIIALEHFKTGEQADLSQLYAIESKLPSSFIRQKIKPILEKTGFLVKINEKSYRWANKQELLKLIKISNKPETSRFQKTLLVTSNGINGLVTALEKRRLARNPYIKLNEDGTATRLRKPFTGALTESEKAAIREADERKAFEKCIGRQSGISQEAAREIQQLKDQAAIEQARKQAEWVNSLQILKYAGLVVGAIGLAAFILTNMHNAPELPEHALYPEHQAQAGGL